MIHVPTHPDADRLCGGCAQQQQAARGGFGGSLEGGGQPAVQLQDAFVGADQSQCALAVRAGGLDLNREQRRGGRDPGHPLHFAGDRLGEAFGRAGGQFERGVPRDAVRDFFERADDGAMRDLHREQQRHASGDAGDRHQLAQRLHAQVVAVEHRQRAQLADHCPLAESAGPGSRPRPTSPSRSGSVNLPSRI